MLNNIAITNLRSDTPETLLLTVESFLDSVDQSVPQICYFVITGITIESYIPGTNSTFSSSNLPLTLFVPIGRS